MKNRKIQNWTLTMAAALVLGVSANAQSAAAMEETHAMAAKARNTASHAAVAKQYRLQAEALDAKATAYENEARKLTRASGAAVRKWPGIATRQLQQAKANAVEARRAAREASLLADTHIRLAVEAQANDIAVAGD